MDDLSRRQYKFFTDMLNGDKKGRYYNKDYSYVDYREAPLGNHNGNVKANSGITSEYYDPILENEIKKKKQKTDNKNRNKNSNKRKLISDELLEYLKNH